MAYTCAVCEIDLSSSEVKYCNHCYKPYCSLPCQRVDWKPSEPGKRAGDHKEHCSQLTETLALLKDPKTRRHLFRDSVRDYPDLTDEERIPTWKCSVCYTKNPAVVMSCGHGFCKGCFVAKKIIVKSESAIAMYRMSTPRMADLLKAEGETLKEAQGRLSQAAQSLKRNTKARTANAAKADKARKAAKVAEAEIAAAELNIRKYRFNVKRKINAQRHLRTAVQALKDSFDGATDTTETQQRDLALRANRAVELSYTRHADEETFALANKVMKKCLLCPDVFCSQDQFAHIFKQSDAHAPAPAAEQLPQVPRSEQDVLTHTALLEEMDLPFRQGAWVEVHVGDPPKLGLVLQRYPVASEEMLEFQDWPTYRLLIEDGITIDWVTDHEDPDAYLTDGHEMMIRHASDAGQDLVQFSSAFFARQDGLAASIAREALEEQQGAAAAAADPDSLYHLPAFKF